MALDEARLIAQIVTEAALDMPEVQKQLQEQGITKEEFVELHALELAIIRQGLEEIPERMVERLKQTNRPHYQLEKVQQIIREATRRALFGKGTRWRRIKDILRILLR